MLTAGRRAREAARLMRDAVRDLSQSLDLLVAGDSPLARFTAEMQRVVDQITETFHPGRFGGFIGLAAESIADVVAELERIVELQRQFGNTEELEAWEKALAFARRRAAEAAQVVEDEFNRALEETARAAEQAAESLRRSTESLLGRGLAASGASGRTQLLFAQAIERQTFEGDRELLAAVQGMELAQFDTAEAIQAVSDAFAEQDSEFAKQLDVANESLRVAQNQLSAQEQTVRALAQVITSLDDFSASLLLGNLSTLSPFAKLQEARAQFGALQGAALGGDVGAAGGLPAAGRAFLEASRAFNASGPGFVSDFEAVREALQAVSGSLGVQKTIEEQQLEAMQATADSLAAQILILEDQREAARIDAQNRINELNAQRAIDEQRFRDILDKWLLQLALLEQIRDKGDPVIIIDPIIQPDFDFDFGPLFEGIQTVLTDREPAIKRPQFDFGQIAEGNSAIVSRLDLIVTETKATVNVLSSGQAAIISRLEDIEQSADRTTSQVRRGFEETEIVSTRE